MSHDDQAPIAETSSYDSIHVTVPWKRIYGNIAVGINAEALWELVGSTNGIEPDASRAAYSFLCEGVCNVIDHAYPSSIRFSTLQSWDVTVSVDAFMRRAVFKVSDIGVGIPASIGLHLGINNLSHADLIRLAVTKQVGSLGAAWRGQGLSGIADKVRRHKGYNLDILTAGYLLSVNADQPEGKMQSALRAPGAAISFSVPLTGDLQCVDE